MKKYLIIIFLFLSFLIYSNEHFIITQTKKTYSVKIIYYFENKKITQWFNSYKYRITYISKTPDKIYTGIKLNISTKILYFIIWDESKIKILFPDMYKKKKKEILFILTI